MVGHLRNKIYKISAAGKEIFSIYLFVVLCFILVLLLSYIVYGIYSRIVWLLLVYGAMNRANGHWRQPIVCTMGCASVCMQRILFPILRVFLGLPSRRMLVWRSDQRASSCVFVFLKVVAR